MAESLRNAIVQLAASPTVSGRDAFYRALLAADVAVSLRALPPGPPPGPATAKAGQLGVPSVRGPDGAVMLLVYVDAAAAREVPGAAGGFTLAGRVVLEMAAREGAGVVVHAGYGPAAAWAGVPASDVPALLARRAAPGR